jgi:ATP-dependent DNA helicase RecG
MIVIDEQHRFGVSQRAALYYKGKAVDLLVMTATPIPRTMLLTLFNDLGVSAIKNKPEGRKPIKTKIISADKRREFYIWLRKRINSGEKGYIVLPLIEKSNFFPHLRSIEEDSEYFKEIFAPLKIGIISGKTPTKKKEKILANFRSGEIKLLISTTVIEVGIDIKDSTIMVIENADKYGLAQLHQLRGRVGRGEKQSFCYLQPSENISDSGIKRLKTIASTNDGFRIAETDLKMRGGGIVSSFEQSGFFDFKVADIKEDFTVFNIARSDALEILNNKSCHTDYISHFLSELDKKIKMISFS